MKDIEYKAVRVGAQGLTQGLCDGVYEIFPFVLHILLSFEWDGQETVVLSVTHVHLHSWITHTHTRFKRKYITIRHTSGCNLHFKRKKKLWV